MKTDKNSKSIKKNSILMAAEEFLKEAQINEIETKMIVDAPKQITKNDKNKQSQIEDSLILNDFATMSIKESKEDINELIYTNYRKNEDRSLIKIRNSDNNIILNDTLGIFILR